MRKLTNDELNRKSVTEFRASEKSPFIIVLDNVRSLNNVGSIFRTADAFLVEAVWLCGITATPPHREIHKTALGATESVEWKYFESSAEAVRVLKERDYAIVSVEQAEGAVSLDRFATEPGKRYALVFGHEIRGVTEEVVNLSDACIEIPQYGTKHSFNVAVSAGIVLWELAGRIKG
ncbi:MAG: RNA methyltransferase [Bacteroidales bacterium]|jgi:tRNA G18 (ribose-2'-O)-methylase SpoU|nr:RNA methyltransferase [Bacteroidales bacterium]MDX9926582.1 RNA methyltransferase [Bacteroidales bacterium]HNX83811.1 RNA methyltransferase [Bacteroidales bacterium]